MQEHIQTVMESHTALNTIHPKFGKLGLVGVILTALIGGYGSIAKNDAALCATIYCAVGTGTYYLVLAYFKISDRRRENAKKKPHRKG